MSRNLLIYLVKLARDAGATDKEIADSLRLAAEEVAKGRFWPSDINQNYTR
jgi:hypothetical protein